MFLSSRLHALFTMETWHLLGECPTHPHSCTALIPAPCRWGLLGGWLRKLFSRELALWLWGGRNKSVNCGFFQVLTFPIINAVCHISTQNNSQTFLGWDSFNHTSPGGMIRRVWHWIPPLMKIPQYFSAYNIHLFVCSIASHSIFL